ncbi:MAG: 1-acyl-sn-glycerol-3-phosphate acyltransferase [Oceanobacter sp.]
MSDPYSDIRPYQDSEVPVVLNRVASSDALAGALLKYRFPALPGWAAKWLTPLLRWRLKQQLSDITTVAEFQAWMATWVTRLLDKTTTQVVVRGLEHMSPDDGNLWISNHRDIAMDPALMNYSLHRAGWPTSRIAIGDNLLGHPDVADVMRLNKSFLVKRDIQKKREKLAALMQLSNYIRHSLDDQASVWIAQREGRAKDGIDATDTAVLKMLTLHGRALKESFSESMTGLRPVPVSIQYEWDPCDILKARELVAKVRDGHYEKEEGEDTRSLLTGVSGFKGTVYVDFGTPLTPEEMASPEDMAAAIDRQIRDMAEIMPIHRAALGLLQRRFERYTQLDAGSVDTDLQQQLLQRVQDEDEAVQAQVLTGYAMPMILQQGES